jgi:hydroxylamine dehydrogenase
MRLRASSVRFRLLVVAVIAVLLSANALAQTAQNVTAQCIDCHTKTTPNIVSDWKQSRHSQVEVGCDTCHGSEHMKADDASRAKIPTPETCGQCHQTQVEQFTKGKHAKAWVAMEAMPTIHYQPMAMTEGMKGCGSCHKLG